MKDVALDIDVIVNCCHGGPGEDGTLTGLLRLAGMRVTGPIPTRPCGPWTAPASAGLVPLARLDRFGIEAIPTIPIHA